MRMWMVDPHLMCIRHIVGEHGEIHKHRHNFMKRHSISGRVKGTVQIEPLAMKTRHDFLVQFLKNHASEYVMPDLSYLPKTEREAKVDTAASIAELSRRCPNCSKKILEEYEWKRKI